MDDDSRHQTMKIHNFQLTKVSSVMIDSRAFFSRKKVDIRRPLKNGDFDAYRILVSVKKYAWLHDIWYLTIFRYKIIAFLKQFHNQIQDPIP